MQVYGNTIKDWADLSKQVLTFAAHAAACWFPMVNSSLSQDFMSARAFVREETVGRVDEQLSMCTISKRRSATTASWQQPAVRAQGEQRELPSGSHLGPGAQQGDAHLLNRWHNLQGTCYGTPIMRRPRSYVHNI
jgi:hypothetical protein